MIVSHNEEQILAFCKETSERAGEVIRSARQRKLITYRYKDDVEVVTPIDEYVDHFIRSEVLQIYPDHFVLSEEGESGKNKESAWGPLWVVDPIDGTVNFIHHHDFVSTAIAFVDEGEVKVGVVNSPFRQEMYWAVKGEGSWCNGSP